MQFEEPTTPKGHPISSPSPYRPRGTQELHRSATGSTPHADLESSPLSSPLRSSTSYQKGYRRRSKANGDASYSACVRKYLCPVLACQLMSIVVAYQIYVVIEGERVLEGVSELQRDFSVKTELDRQRYQHIQDQVNELKTKTKSLDRTSSLSEAKVDTLIKYGVGGGEDGQKLVGELKETLQELVHQHSNVRRREENPEAFALKYEEKGVRSTAEYCNRPASRQELIELNLGKAGYADRGKDIEDRLKLSKVYVALNLKDNKAVMPHLLSQIVYVLQLFDLQNSYVSIYESGSEDDTQTHLQDWVQILGKLGVRLSVRSTNEKRFEEEYRIDFLALMRNRAMEPLYESDWADPVKREMEGVHQSSFDYVWFINDILFCAEDAVRLFLYPESHMTCALDLFYWAEPENHLRLYDYWVARSRNGRRLQLDHPFVPEEVDPEARKLAEKWRAFPLSCCWNGMVVVDPNVFVNPHNVRFRTEGPKECSQSEVNHFCTDMWRAGFTNIHMDPYVMNAYKWEHFGNVKELKKTIRRPHIRGSKPLYMESKPNTTECCPHHRGEEDVRTTWDGTHECHDMPT